MNNCEENTVIGATVEKKSLMDYINDDNAEREIEREFISAKTAKQEMSELIRRAGNCYDRLRKREYSGIEESTKLFVTGMVSLHEAKEMLYVLDDPERTRQTILRLRASLNKLFFPSGKLPTEYREGELRWGHHIRFR